MVSFVSRLDEREDSVLMFEQKNKIVVPCILYKYFPFKYIYNTLIMYLIYLKLKYEKNCNFQIQSNPVITTSVYTAPRLCSQIFCDTN